MRNGHTDTLSSESQLRRPFSERKEGELWADGILDALQ